MKHDMLFRATLLALAPFAASAAPQVVERTADCKTLGTCPVALADANAAGERTTTSTIAAPATLCSGAPIDSLQVGVDIGHSHVGDLGIELVAPSGTVIPLMFRPSRASGAVGSCSGDDMALRFTTGAAPTPECGVQIPALSGNAAPADSLESLNNTPTTAGNWQLRVTDYAAGGYGLLRNWTLAFQCDIADTLFSNGFE